MEKIGKNACQYTHSGPGPLMAVYGNPSAPVVLNQLIRQRPKGPKMVPAPGVVDRGTSGTSSVAVSGNLPGGEAVFMTWD